MKRPVTVMLVGFALFVGVAVARVSLRLKVIHLGYEISEATSQRMVLEEENRKLRTEKSLLVNPERLKRLAVEELDMRSPDPSGIRALTTSDLNEARQ